MKKRILCALAALATTGLAGVSPAQAEDCSAPCIDFYGYADLSGTWNRFSKSPEDNYFSLMPSAEFTASFRPIDGFSVFSHIVTESVVDEEPGKDHYFDTLGTYVAELDAQFDLNGLGIRLGKFHPAFGRAWDITPGLHGADLAGSYEMKERIGGNASYGFETGKFSNAIQIGLFTTDRSFLSESAFNNRGRLTLDDGGAGNTSGLSSLALSFDGCLGAAAGGCYDEGSFGYQLGARFQKGGAESAGDELGFLGGLNAGIALDGGGAIKLFTELAWFENFDGGADDALFLTASAALVQGPVTYSLAYTQERALTVGPDLVEHLFDATVSYALDESFGFAGEHWTVAAGYSFDKADEGTTHFVGFTLSTEFNGSHSFK